MRTTLGYTGTQSKRTGSLVGQLTVAFSLLRVYELGKDPFRRSRYATIVIIWAPNLRGCDVVTKVYISDRKRHPQLLISID